MKDFSLFLLKNSLGSKMRKGITTFCNGDSSTSTLDQHNAKQMHHHEITNDTNTIWINQSSPKQTPPPTLEEMILQLQLEEEIARKAKLHEYNELMRGRMSCVNNSDILRSARNALNQYPRFSLDGKDAMYRSSFRTSLDAVDHHGKANIVDRHGPGGRMNLKIEDMTYCLPSKIGGEKVVWRKPGVVAKLMGLDAIPVPVMIFCSNKPKLSSVTNRQKLMRRAERHHMQRRVPTDTRKV